MKFCIYLLPLLWSKLFAQSPDSVTMRQVDSLIQISNSFIEVREFEKAIEVNEKAEKIVRDKIGGFSFSLSNCIFNKGKILYEMEKYEESEKCYLQCQSILENVLGRENGYYANCLKNLSNIYYMIGNYAKSEELNIEELGIRERTVGKDKSEYISSLNNLANLYATIGNYPKAETLMLSSKEICEKVLGKEDSETINVLNNLAILYYNLALYEKAVPLFIETMDIRKRKWGREHPEYTASLNNLATLYSDMGNFIASESLYLEAKSINEKILGKDHSDVVMNLQNLGALYWKMGDYAQSEQFQLDAMDILRRTQGMQNPANAMGLNNLGIFYQTLGNFPKAEQLLLEALSVREEVLGKDHPDYAYSLNGLASLYKVMGKYDIAEEHFIEMIGIIEKSLGKEHPYYTLGISNLANIYSDVGKFEKSESLFLEASAINEKILGRNQPEFATILDNLADLYVKIAKLDKAEKLYHDVMDIRKEVLGAAHPEFAKTLLKLSRVCEAQNRFSESEILLKQFFEIRNSNLLKTAAFLSEQELASFNGMENDGDVLASCLFNRRAHGNPEGSLPDLIYNQSLFQKGFLLNAAERLKTLKNLDPEAEDIYNRIKGFRRRLAIEYTLPFSERDSSEIAVLEDELTKAEKRLGRIVTSLSDTIRRYNWYEVEESLLQDPTTKMSKQAAIEFIHFSISDSMDSVQYGALLLLSGMKHPKFIPLFQEKELDHLVSVNGSVSDRANFLYATRGAKPIDSQIVLSEKLYQLVWEPILKELANVVTIYFSPSGRLNQFNLSAIPIDNKIILSDKYKIVQLGSTRQLLTSKVFEHQNRIAALFGGIQYDLKEDQALSQNPDFPKEKWFSSRGLISFTQGNRNQRNNEWMYLPGTANEVSLLEECLHSNDYQTKAFTAQFATEEAMKELGSDSSGSPQILHLATHGYFFSDPRKESQTSIGSKEESVFKISENPMIRSGIILAGGNYTWKTGKPYKPGIEDGILTAYEILLMDLSNTELVVLSACETGLGDIHGNEGVYGLQRAFKIAGAKYLIMSLWQVPDKQTSLLMTTFYKKWLEDKMTIPDAFHAAQKQLRDNGLDPYNWAGFVLVE